MRWRNMGQENEGEPGMGSMRVLETLSGVGGRVWVCGGGQHLSVDNATLGRRSLAHHVDVEVKQSVLKGSAVVDMGWSSMDDTEDVDVYMCMATSHGGHIHVSRVTLPSRR